MVQAVSAAWAVGTVPGSSPQAEVGEATGAITRPIAAERRIGTGRLRTGLEAVLAVIRCPNVSLAHGNKSPGRAGT